MFPHNSVQTLRVVDLNIMFITRCRTGAGGGQRSRQLTFQNQIPRATIFRFPRLHRRFPMPPFCQIPQIPQITPVPRQIPRATFLPDSPDSPSDSPTTLCTFFIFLYYQQPCVDKTIPSTERDRVLPSRSLGGRSGVLLNVICMTN